MMILTIRRWKSALGIAFVAALVMGGSVSSGQKDKSVPKRLLDLANQERRKAGAPPLRWDADLARAAQKHAQTMADHGKISHHFSDEPELGGRLSETHAHYNAYAENVGSSGDPEEMNDAWMHSPGHRRNMLNPDYDIIGIGVVWRGSQMYAVQDFARAFGALSMDQFEHQTLDAISAVRKQYRLPAVSRIESARLRTFACSASRPTLGVDVSRSASEVHLFSYTTTTPAGLPGVVITALQDSGVRRAALGSCQITDDQGFTKYRVQLNLLP